MYKQGRKCRDISPKYRVSKDTDTIFHGEISVRRYFRINREESHISRDISAIFPDISHGQRSQTRYSAVNELQWASHLLPRGFEVVQPLTIWAN